MQFLKKRNEKALFVGKIGLIVILCIGCVIAVKISLSITEQPDKEEFASAGNAETFFVTDADKSSEQSNPTCYDLSEAESVIISEAGEYLLTGMGKEPVIVDAQDQMVHLFLDNVEIRTSCGPALLIKSAGKVIITLADDSSNVLQDAAAYTGYEDYDAAIYSQPDLTINGNGTLYIYGYYEDAIHSKDVVKLLGGDVYVQAKQDGLKGNDGVLVSASELSIESEQYGIRTTKSGKQHKGDIDLCGGSISIIAGQYALVSDTDLYVRNCDLYCNSVVSDMDIGGNQYVEEGCYNNE